MEESKIKNNIRKESTGRPCLEGERLVNVTLTITAQQREWLKKQGKQGNMSEMARGVFKEFMKEK